MPQRPTTCRSVLEVRSGGRPAPGCRRAASSAGQDLTAQHKTLHELGVPEARIYLDQGSPAVHRDRPGPAQALGAVREGDTLVVPKLEQRGARLQLGGDRVPTSATQWGERWPPVGVLNANILVQLPPAAIAILPPIRIRNGTTRPRRICGGQGRTVPGSTSNARLRRIRRSSGLGLRRRR